MPIVFIIILIPFLFLLAALFTWAGLGVLNDVFPGLPQTFSYGDAVKVMFGLWLIGLPTLFASNNK